MKGYTALHLRQVWGAHLRPTCTPKRGASNKRRKKGHVALLKERKKENGEVDTSASLKERKSERLYGPSLKEKKKGDPCAHLSKIKNKKKKKTRREKESLRVFQIYEDLIPQSQI